MLPTTVNEISSLTTFDEFIEYSFPKDGSLSKLIPNKNNNAFQNIGVGLIAMIGATPFAITGNQYAISTYGDNLGMRVYFTLASFMMGFGLFYNATVTFLDYHRREQIPNELAELLINPMTPSEQLAKKAILGLGSMISAVPLSLLTLLYPIPGFPDWIKYVLFMMVLVSNTVLHFLPIELAFQNLAYRLPFYPFEQLYYYLKDQPLSQEERHRKKERLKNDGIYDTHLKNFIIERLNKTLTALTLSVECRYFKYEVLLKEETLKKDKFLSLSPKNKLLILCKYGKNISASAPNEFTNQTLDYLGAFWGLIADAGYLVATNLALIALTDSVAGGIFLALLPTYFYGVLVAFYGSCTLVSCSSYFTEWKRDDVKFSLPFRLSLIPSLFYIPLSIVVAGAAYGTSVKLIQDSINLPFPSVPIIIAVSISNAVFVTLYIMFQFYSMIVTDILLYGEKNDAQWVTQLHTQVNEFIYALSLLDGEKLIGFLNNFSEKELKKAGLSKDTLEQCRGALNTEENDLSSKDKGDVFSCIAHVYSQLKTCFFGCDNSSLKKSLLENDAFVPGNNL